jgi:hypothetical protein
MNTNVAQPAQEIKQRPHEHPAYWAGFSRYAKGQSITCCQSMNEVRGWLYGEYAEQCSDALKQGGERLVWSLRKSGELLNPDLLSDAEVEGMVRQAEDSEERREQEYLRRGW